MKSLSKRYQQTIKPLPAHYIAEVKTQMQKTKFVLAITALALVAVALIGVALVAAQPLGTYNSTVQNNVPCNEAYAQNCYQYMQGQTCGYGYGYCQDVNQNGQFQMGMGFGGCHR
jgi:hypothetical protein